MIFLMLSVPKEYKIPLQNLCPDFDMKNIGAVTIVPVHSWAQRVFAKVDWHMNLGVLSGGKGGVG